MWNTYKPFRPGAVSRTIYPFSSSPRRPRSAAERLSCSPVQNKVDHVFEDFLKHFRYPLVRSPTVFTLHPLIW